MSNHNNTVILLQNELSIVLREKKLGATVYGLFSEPIDDVITHLEKSILLKIEQLNK